MSDLNSLQTFSPPDSFYEPTYPTLAEESARESALGDRESSIESTREELLNKLDLEESDVYEWDGDDPKDVGEPDYSDEDGCFYFRKLPYIRVTLKDGRIYYFTDGERNETFEKRVDPAELTERTEG